jgi:stage V sporulation protein G
LPIKIYDIFHIIDVIFKKKFKIRRIIENFVEFNKLDFIFHNKKAVNKMEVTDVRLRRVNTDGRMRAIASITLDNEFVVHDIRVIDGNNGLFVAMPSKRTPDGEFRDIAHPINSGTRGKIQEAVLAEYHRLGELEIEFEEAGAS